MNWEELKQRGSEHYKTSGGVEPIDLYRSAGMLRHFALSNIIKYAYRNANPDEPMNLEDMEKIKHYAEMLIVEYFDEPNKPSPGIAGFKSMGVRDHEKRTSG